MAAAAAIVSGLIKEVAATRLLAGPALVSREVEESEDEKESPSYRILHPLVPELELLALQREFISSSLSPVAPVPTLLVASLFMLQRATEMSALPLNVDQCQCVSSPETAAAIGLSLDLNTKLD
jgi:hypothetical protein